MNSSARPLNWLTNLKGQSRNPVTNLLLDYLLRDEQKHDTMLGDLEKFKQHMSKIS